jgi:hypothetical protein
MDKELSNLTIVSDLSMAVTGYSSESLKVDPTYIYIDI